MTNYKEFRSKRNKVIRHITKYRPEDIILFCVNFLNKADATEPARMSIIQPWFLLLIIKWAVLYRVPQAYRTLLPQNFQKINSMFFELNGAIKLPSQYSHTFLFLRNLAFQQFWLQEQPVILRMARQSLFFSSLPNNHKFRQQFLQKTGVSFEAFIDLSIVLMSRFYSQNYTATRDPIVPMDLFTPLNTAYSHETVERFLSSISINLSNLRSLLKDNETKLASQTST